MTSHMTNMEEFMQLRKQKNVVEIKCEVNKYLTEASEDLKNTNFDLIIWWKENAHRFLIMFQRARDVFVVPASTVASESAFSLGGRVLDPFRASLTPRMVKTLVYTGDWIKARSKPLWNETTRDEMEQYAEGEKLEAAVTNIRDMADV